MANLGRLFRRTKQLPLVTPPPETPFWQRDDGEPFLDAPSSVSSISTPPRRLPRTPRKKFGPWQWILALSLPSACLVAVFYGTTLLPNGPSTAQPAYGAVTAVLSPEARASVLSTEQPADTKVSPSPTAKPARTEYVQGHWVNGYTRRVPGNEYSPSPSPSGTPYVEAPVSSSGSGSSTYVNSYTRKDGTYVHGYERGSSGNEHHRK